MTPYLRGLDGHDLRKQAAPGPESCANSARPQAAQGSAVLSPSALVMYEAMGRGFMMRVAHGSQLAQFVNTRPSGYSSAVVGCGFGTRDIAAVNELIASGLVHQLTEHGEPPVGSKERARLGGWRSGWRELGLDGDVADWWVCTQ